MQDFIREQSTNSKSYNMVVVLTDYASEFLTHLQFPVAFDTFVRTLEALLEFTQGPNKKNQEIVIQHNFIDIGNAILQMEFRDDEAVVHGKEGNVRGFRISKQLSLAHSLESFRPKSTQKLSGKHKFDISADEIELPVNNFMISLAKYKCLLVLNQLLEGRAPTSYVYYIFRRVLDPDVFRLNFAYQSYFIRKFHKNEYHLKMFFRYNNDMDGVQSSPLIIEVGYELYFLLMKMQDNLYKDMDEKYYNRLIRFLTNTKSHNVAIDTNIIIAMYHFCSDITRLAFRCCRVKRTKVSNQKVNTIKNSNFRMTDILMFYAANASKVEVIKDGTSEHKYFPILPFCKFSSEAPKEKFLREAVRTNSKTKCESLMKESKYLITDLKVNYWLKTGLTRFIGLLQIYLEMIKSLLSYAAFVLNFIILCSYTDSTGSRTEDPEFPGTSVKATEIVLIVVGSVTILLIFLVFSNSVINKIPIKIMRYQVLEAEKQKRMKESGAMSYNLFTGTTVYSDIKKVFIISIDILTDFMLIFYFALLVLTFMGAIWHPFFYTFLLAYPIFRSQALMNVLQAIWYPRYTLGLTIALMFMIIYAMTVISFYYYHNDYTQNDCYSLWTCFVISFDHTFKNDGGLGGYLESAYTQKANSVDVNISRVIYDNIAFLLVGILLIEIISGIIIDTFAELRQKNNEILADSSSFCFICDLSRDDLEKMYGANGFSMHVKMYHNLWDYLFYIAYLETKREREGKLMNTSEKYVIEKIDADNHSWLPCYA